MSWVADSVADWLAWYGQGADEATATRALTAALATVESWLDRPLELMERTQEQWGPADPILLRAWPVETLVSIAVGDGVTAPALDAVRLDKRTGRLGLMGCYPYAAVTYAGGFATMPADIEIALWQVAAALHPAMASASGAPGGAQVSRVTTPDVGTVEFRAGAAAGTSSDVLLGGTLSPAIEALLQHWRNESVVGAA